MTKRQPTDYVVLLEVGTATAHGRALVEVGAVSAYTPEQARGKAAHLPPVRSTATSEGAANVYAVPERNMRPGRVEAVTKTRVTGGTNG
jgi:uncharacterized protein with beta-barrel porin domain